MKEDGIRRAIVTLSAATLMTSVAALCIGRYPVSASEVVGVLASKFFNVGRTWDAAVENVVLLLRLPRVAAAFLIGGGLSLSGATYQSIFKNQLAAPELLGVFQGSCVGAAIAILLGANNIFIQILALAGGIMAVVMTKAITSFFKNDSTAILVLSGVIVSGLMRSILGMLKYIMDTETQLPAITYWELGSLSDMTMQKVLTVAPTMVVTMALLLAMRWQFNLLSLGDDEARSLGVNVPVVRGVTITCATLLTSCAVCLGGTILWVGLIIPHLGRFFAGPDNVKLSPVAVLAGAIFLIAIDTAARSLTGVEIPLSILTGLVGAPIFIVLISRKSVKLK
ncbi:MAG: iron ABC transporter permease [Synergistaceae bacterium]|jgi:iron complex transport system permease protein|nr:iron ABC transporter permease [Synergistaceae bacterium]